VAKAKKTRDRRAVVEQMRREQKRAEKRRGYAILGACLVVALSLIGLAVFQGMKTEKLASGALTSLGVSADAAGCQDVTTKPATGNSEHRPEGTDITYADAPPAFGPHYPSPAPMSRKFYTDDERPKLEYLVHNLEHGYNILWYDATIAEDSDQLATVRAIAAKFSGTELRNKFIAAPWTGDDGKPFPDGAHIALTHWSMGGTHGNAQEQTGIWQYCAEPSGEVVESFVEDYPYLDSPEPNAL
jgi:hypothetical protein